MPSPDTGTHDFHLYQTSSWKPTYTCQSMTHMHPENPWPYNTWLLHNSTTFRVAQLQHLGDKYPPFSASVGSPFLIRYGPLTSYSSHQGVEVWIMQLLFALPTFPVPGFWDRPTVLIRHGGAGGGLRWMTSQKLVGKGGGPGSGGCSDEDE